MEEELDDPECQPHDDIPSLLHLMAGTWKETSFTSFYSYTTTIMSLLRYSVYFK